MRGFRLNGWQRVGIVLSIGWVIWGGYEALRSNVADAVHQDNATYDTCYFFETQKKTYDVQKCQKQSEVAREQVMAKTWDAVLIGVTIALVSVLIAWLVAYGLVGLVRWIRSGFKSA